VTCIVGVVSGERVWLGGDSAGVGGYSLAVRKDEKVFSRGPYVMGFTTSYRMGQLLRYSGEIPTPPADADLMAFMVTDFIGAVRKVLADGGYRRRENEVETGGTFLVGVSGRLFRVDSDFQVGEALDGMDACGSGAEVALGALTVLAGLLPGARLERALSASEQWNAGVRRPFVIVGGAG